MEPFFRSYHDSLQERFGCRVYKVSIDAGFTCPNRDGEKGVGGCTFCDERGSSSRTNRPTDAIVKQILRNIEVRKNRFGAEKFIAYFQSYTNTYAPIAHLKEIYDQAIYAHPDIIGLAISTRADCVDRDKLELIASYKKMLPHVSIEYGLQTVHEHTLEKINRKETHAELVQAIRMTQEEGIDHCVHVILGLPGESREEILQTADFIARYKIQGVKIHFLVIMEHTALAKDYLAGACSVLSMDEGISLACDFLERIPADCIIYRIGGNGHPLHAIAPEWVWKQKTAVIEGIKKEFTRRGTRQGAHAKY